MSKLPISRDVRVPRATETAPAPGRDAHQDGGAAAPNLVTVMGFDRGDVLFRSDEVGCVQWRDSDGAVVALLVRLKPDLWGFSRRGEEDWPQVLEQYGSPDIQ